MTERQFRERRSAFTDETSEAPPSEPETPTTPVEPEVRAAEEPIVREPVSEDDLLTPADVPEPSFLEIVQMLAFQALQLMGADPLGTGGQQRVMPDEARRIIDLIGILQDRTRGNLTPQESAALEQVLSDLRLHFVNLRRARP